MNTSKGKHMHTGFSVRLKTRGKHMKEKNCICVLKL